MVSFRLTIQTIISVLLLFGSLGTLYWTNRLAIDRLEHQVEVLEKAAEKLEENIQTLEQYHKK
jgi:hypothetical protein